ncbi:MAG: hypothetical protein KAX33_03790 [Candidatus Lokiarchaeota archaeon]|nr:hypothetical protein [Candidatus Lokiarchaeota archaeon]MCK4281295.1 hypothetical protein [Candidatus Lokiarchaeota archaeon]
MIQRKTTTIQISLKTKEYLDEIKEREQLSTYDAVIRIVLLNYELFREFRFKDRKIDESEKIKE